MTQTLLAVFALVTGAMVPVQLALNAELGLAMKSPFLGAFFVFLVGVLALLVVVIVSGQAWPGMTEIAAVPWSAWAGGLIATAYIVAVVVLVPRLGVGSTAVLIIAGQLVAALALDHLGVFAAPDPMTIKRAAGAVLVLTGAALVKF